MNQAVFEIFNIIVDAIDEKDHFGSGHFRKIVVFASFWIDKIVGRVRFCSKKFLVFPLPAMEFLLKFILNIDMDQW